MAGQASTDTLTWGRLSGEQGGPWRRAREHLCACREEGMKKRNLFLQAPAQGRLLCHLPRTPVLGWGEGLTLRGHSQWVVGISRTRDQESSSFTDLHFLMPW